MGIMTSWQHENGETGWGAAGGRSALSVPALLAFVPRPDSFSFLAPAHPFWCYMGECCSRAELGEIPMMDDQTVPPTKCHCGPFGMIYAVVGNIHFGIIVIASILYVPSRFFTHLLTCTTSFLPQSRNRSISLPLPASFARVSFPPSFGIIGTIKPLIILTTIHMILNFAIGMVQSGSRLHWPASKTFLPCLPL